MTHMSIQFSMEFNGFAADALPDVSMIPVALNSVGE